MVGCTSLADIHNQFFVARASKDNNYQNVNFTVERFGDIPMVIGDRGYPDRPRPCRKDRSQFSPDSNPECKAGRAAR
jgi:hypothetical protein